MDWQIPGAAGMGTKPAVSGLTAQVRQQVEQNRQDDADQDRGAEGKIEGDVLAAMNKVAGQTAERKNEAAGEDQQGSGQRKQKTETEKRFSQVIHRRHTKLEYRESLAPE